MAEKKVVLIGIEVNGKDHMSSKQVAERDAWTSGQWQADVAEGLPRAPLLKVWTQGIVENTNRKEEWIAYVREQVKGHIAAHSVKFCTLTGRPWTG